MDASLIVVPDDDRPTADGNLVSLEIFKNPSPTLAAKPQGKGAIMQTVQ
jgi:hypothetical protein